MRYWMFNTRGTVAETYKGKKFSKRNKFGTIFKTEKEAIEARDLVKYMLKLIKLLRK